MLDIIIGGVIAYLAIGLLVWAFISYYGGFFKDDGVTPAPFWPCLFATILMWPAALSKLEIL